jgi:transcriptional regulator with XRE-family HTH domain
MMAVDTTTGVKMDFIAWLEEEMEQRRWQKSDLSRASGISHSAISLVLSGDRGIGPDFCNGIARAFRIPPEEVFRRAGILPPLPEEDDELRRQLVERFIRLPIEKRREVLSYVIWKIQESRLEDMPGLADNGTDRSVPSNRDKD